MFQILSIYSSNITKPINGVCNIYILLLSLLSSSLRTFKNIIHITQKLLFPIKCKNFIFTNTLNTFWFCLIFLPNTDDIFQPKKDAIVQKPFSQTLIILNSCATINKYNCRNPYIYNIMVNRLISNFWCIHS